MRGKVKGIIMEINKNNAIIMTQSGEFIKVKKPPFEISPGDEITSRAANNMSFMKYTAIAAAIMIMLLPFIYFKQAMATVAYVNVDINPSLELGINKYNNVNSIISLNSDASKLIKDIPLKGLQINDALEKVISKAKNMGYIGDGKPNNIEITLVKLKNNANINQDELVEYTKSAVKKSDVDAKLKFYNADKQIFDNAKKENMSPNKYMDKNHGKEKLEIDVKKSPSESSGNQKSKATNTGNENDKTIEDDKSNKGNGNAPSNSQPAQGSGKSGPGKGNATENGNKNSSHGNSSKGGAGSSKNQNHEKKK